MCNLSQGIEDRALEKGLAEGKAIGLSEGKTAGIISAQINIILNMYKNNFTIEQISLATQYNIDEIKEIIRNKKF